RPDHQSHVLVIHPSEFRRLQSGARGNHTARPDRSSHGALKVLVKRSLTRKDFFGEGTMPKETMAVQSKSSQKASASDCSPAGVRRCTNRVRLLACLLSLALNAAGQDVSQHVVVPLFEHKDHRRIIQPLAFEKTSANSAAAFLARGSRSRLLLTKDEAVLALPKRSLAASSQRSGNSRQAERQPALRMKFAGANQGAVITGEDPLPGKIYHANADSKGPLTCSDTYRRVKYSGIYPGIDAVYYGNDQQLEFDLIVAPHADPKQIRLSFAGADKISLNESGEIAFQLAGEEIRLKKPAIYQEHDGIREEIAGGYRLSRSEARF